MHAARHRRPTSPRARRLGLVAALLGLVAALTPPGPATAQVADPCGGNYAPTVVSTTVNQGLGTYTPLVRGKTTLVRLFLKAPSCAGSSVRLVSAQVQARESGALIAERSTTPDPLGPVYPVLESTTPLSDNGPAHPVVQLPALGQGTSSAATTLTFDATVTYQYQPLTAAAPVTGTTRFPSVATSAMAPPSNPLRVLVVPMGDASAARSSQFPTKANGGVPVNGQWADTVAQTSMQTLSRTFPVPDGVSDLTATTGGLRYRLALGAMVDLGPNGLKHQPAGGKVCIDPGTFVADVGGKSIASELANHLNAWNADNPATKADRVVGVTWQGISGGTAGLPGSDLSCAEGLATLNGTTSYLRLLAGNVAGVPPVSNPSMSGALATMEIAHTAGSVAPTDPRYDGTHSKNTTADPDGTRRAYDPTTGRWLEQPVSGLRYTGDSSGYVDATRKPSPWNDTNVLLERPDYAFLQCELTPALALSSCPSGAVRGGLTTAAAGAGVVISGTTDGTVAGTQLTSSFDASAEPTQPDPLSDYRLVLRDADGSPVPACTPGSLGCTDDAHLRLPVAAFESSHDHDGATSVPHTSLGTLSLYAATAVDARATRLEVWKGRPTAPCTSSAMPAGCLYARESSTPPVVQAGGTGSGLVASDLAPAVTDAGDDLSPAVSPSGDVLAWSTAAGVVLQRRDGSTGRLTGPRTPAFRGVEPAWAPDGRSLAYATADGDIERRAVTRTGGTLTVGAATTVYDHLLQDVTRDGGALAALDPSRASSPSFSPSGAEVAVLINGGVWRLRADAPSNEVVCDLAGLSPTSTCRSVVQPAAGQLLSAPDWGTTDAAGLIAFVQNGSIATVDPQGGQRTVRVDRAEAPAWGGGLLGFVQDGGVWVADPTTAGADGRYVSRTRLTQQSGDGAPAIARDARVLALHRGLLPGSHDIAVGTLTDGRSDVTFSATTDGDPQLLRAHVSLSCGAGTEPVLVDLRPLPPRPEEPRTARFSGTYDRANGCPGGTLSALVTNGWDVSERETLRTYPVDPTPPAPSPAVSTPREGGQYLQYDAVVGVASSIDPAVGTNAGERTLTWTVTGPAGSGIVDRPVGTGPTVTVQPSPQGHAPGTWSLTLTTSAPSGATSSRTVRYTVLPDPAHLGVNAVVTFEPQTLFVPSNGNSVTVRVRPQAQRLDRVAPGSVRITSVGGTAVDLPVVRTDGWTRNTDGSWTAKFDRQALTGLMARTGLVGHYVQVVVQGGSGTDAFTGYDPRYPTTTPA